MIFEVLRPDLGRISRWALRSRATFRETPTSEIFFEHCLGWNLLLAWQFLSSASNFSFFFLFPCLRCLFFCFAAFMSRFFSTFMPCLVSSITLGLFFINVLVSICSLVSFFALRLIYSCGCSLVGLRVFCVVSLFRKGVPFCFLSLPWLQWCAQNRACFFESRFFAWTLRSCVFFR